MKMNEIFLKFENESFSLFVSPTNENILFGKDYEPVAIDIPLENGETYAEVLYNSPIYFLILELKEILKIEHVDVHVDMPLLEIDFDQESAVLKQKSLAEFVRFHESLSLYHDIPVSSFEFLLKKCDRSVKSRMEFLERISLEGGLVANPIVIDDSSSNPDAVEDTDQLNDNNTDQFDEIDQDLLSETSFDDLTGAGLVSTSGNDDIIIDTEGQENSKIDSEIIDSGINIHVDSDASVARDLIFTRVEHNEFDKNDNIEFKTEDESNLERADSEVIDSGINKCFVFEDIVSEKMSEEGAIENDDGLFIIDEDVEDSNLVNDSFVPKEAGVNIPLEEVGFEHDKIIIPNSITEEAFEHNGHTDGVEEKGNISSPLGKRELDVLSTGKN